MRRLIDADALIKDLEYDVELDARALDDTDLSLGINRELVQFDKDCKQNAIDMLKKAPPVDAMPVIHGKWIQDEFGSKCGSCGLYAYRDKFDQPWESPYCPNCGAKMDGDKHGTD